MPSHFTFPYMIYYIPCLKGIDHKKKKICHNLLIIYKHLALAIDYDNMEEYYESQWLLSTGWLPTIFEFFIFFVLNGENKTHTVLEQEEGELSFLGELSLKVGSYNRKVIIAML